MIRDQETLEARLQSLLKQQAQNDVVLFVDDEPNILEAMVRSMHEEPFEVRTANGGAQALEILAQEPISLVISDEDMPVMRGSALLSQVRERFPAVTRFLLTGKATLDLALKAINEGEVHRFYTKPCPIDVLISGIHQGLEHQRLQSVAYELLKENLEHQTVLGTLEESHPGITQVNRDPDGTIVIEP